MKYRILGKTGLKVSEISLGTWQVGGKWGSGFDDKLAENILNTAIDNGVNFLDTADVYEGGMSERAVGKVVRARSEKVLVATKCGRRINPHVSEGYTTKILRKHVEDSLKRTGLETLDLVQLHCPPTDVYYRPEIFDFFNSLKKEGTIQHFGVSVGRVEEALKAIEYENVESIQIIFNIFRQRPAELFFEQAQKKNIGVIARVPLASGLLTGKFDKDTRFDKDDHRNFNRNGDVFDNGETFSGINYEQGIEAVEKLKQLFPNEQNLAPLALQWILSHQQVSCIIPGASKTEHVYSNLSVFERQQLTTAQINSINNVYIKWIKPTAHQLW